MKKSITWFLLLAMAVSPLVAVSNDYIAGYRQGYLDGSIGVASEYPEGSKSTATSQFEIRYFVDDFGDPTDKGYVTQRGFPTGTFSNSATRNSRITWYLILSKTEASFVINEYGSYRVTGSSAYPDHYDISIKESDGNVLTFAGENHSDRISLRDRDIDRFVNIISTGEEVKISIRKKSNYDNSSYNLGNVSFDGAKELYDQLK